MGEALHARAARPSLVAVAALVVAAGLGAPTRASSPMLTPRCAARPAIDGSDRGETIRGTVRADGIFAFGGNDRVLAGAGDDCVYGGSGNDRISSVNGVAEVVRCGAGRDIVRADPNDRLIGCERVKRVARPSLPAARPRLAGPRSTFVVGFRPPFYGEYDVSIAPR